MLYAIAIDLFGKSRILAVKLFSNTYFVTYLAIYLLNHWPPAIDIVDMTPDNT